MPTTDESAEKPTTGTPAWAKQFALRRQKAAHVVLDLETDAETWPTLAMETLWTMFDQAVEQAQGALDEYGLLERIVTERTSHDYRLSMPGSGGELRQIAVFADVVMVAGHMSGGSHISTNQTRATIYLVPSLAGKCLRWIVEATGKDFTPRVVDDLFLSVFSDDPAATTRLSAYFTLTP